MDDVPQDPVLAGLDEQLSALPLYDVPQHQADALERIAGAEFARVHQLEPARAAFWRSPYWSGAYRRLEPAMVALFCIGYLGWAFQRAALLLSAG